LRLGTKFDHEKGYGVMDPGRSKRAECNSEIILLLPFVLRGLKLEMESHYDSFEKLVINYVVFKNNMFYRKHYTDRIITFLDKLRLEIQKMMVNKNTSSSNLDIATEKFHRLLHSTDEEVSSRIYLI
jgi:hypothetical protein